MAGRSPDGTDQCGPCSGVDSIDFRCRRCGYPGDIYTDKCCSRCVARDRVTHLLSGPDGTVPEQLQPLAEALGNAEDPWSVLAWTRARGGRLLAQLAALGHEISHHTLDALPPSGAVHRVRAVLVSTGALPWRNENLASLTSWLARTTSQLAPHHAQVIKPFAEWQIIRDARRRASRGHYSAGAAHADRLDIKAAILYLTWLDAQERTLRTATQHDLDLFLATHPPKRRTLGPFVRWAIARRLTAPGLTAPKKPGSRPSHFLTEEQQLDQLRRCLSDDTLPLEVRIIGAFVRLYAQQVSRIVTFTIDRYSTHDGRSYFTFAAHPVLLPPTLAALVEQQIAAPRLSDILAPASNRTFLFPGRPPSRPRTATSVLTLMRAHHLPILSARNTAMIEAVTELPPVVVSDLFGITAATATRWGHLASTSWAAYLAARDAGLPEQ
ncbi:hypothetical protein ACIPRD_12615 [Streptomyces sp. NPDC090108]|uniref:hypothetical protein n=1 Tax=Streptomyces sp. NPDC090108 TaxID=3365947 RepID=UPI00380083CA